MSNPKFLNAFNKNFSSSFFIVSPFSLLILPKKRDKVNYLSKFNFFISSKVCSSVNGISGSG